MPKLGREPELEEAPLSTLTTSGCCLGAAAAPRPSGVIEIPFSRGLG